MQPLLITMKDYSYCRNVFCFYCSLLYISLSHNRCVHCLSAIFSTTSRCDQETVWPTATPVNVCIQQPVQHGNKTHVLLPQSVCHWNSNLRDILHVAMWPDAKIHVWRNHLKTMYEDIIINKNVFEVRKKEAWKILQYWCTFFCFILKENVHTLLHVITQLQMLRERTIRT